ncbi:hypothetical protein IAT40_005994 [Kwoniella sp. CBS 6097]
MTTPKEPLASLMFEDDESYHNVDHPEEVTLPAGDDGFEQLVQADLANLIIIENTFATLIEMWTGFRKRLGDVISLEDIKLSSVS